MKIKKIFITIILIIILILNFIQTASFADEPKEDETPVSFIDHYFTVPANTWKSENKKVQVTTGINAANLTLTNGLELVNISTNTNDNTQLKTVTDAIEIICIVDISGSMAGSRISSLKSALDTFGNYAYNGFSDLKMDIITFSSVDNGKIILSGCDDKDKFLSVVSSIESDDGGTMIFSAFDRAVERINEIQSSEDDSDRKIFLINLTDGEDFCFARPEAVSAASNCTLEYTRGKLNEANELIEGTFNVLFELPSSQVFDTGSDYSDLGTTYGNVSTSDIETIYNSILDEIMNNFFAGDIQLEMKSGSRYCSATSDNIFMTLDTELTQSSVVKLEYFVMIHSSEELKQIAILCNLDNNAIFNSNEKFITSDRTNEDYRWFVSNNDAIDSLKACGWSTVGEPANNRMVTIVPPKMCKFIEDRKEQGAPVTFKIVLYYLLSPNSDLDFNNTFQVRVWTKDKDSKYRVYNAFNGDEIENIKVTVVPPFGANKNYTPTIYSYIAVLMGIYLIVYRIKKRYVTAQA